MQLIVRIADEDYIRDLCVNDHIIHFRYKELII